MASLLDRMRSLVNQAFSRTSGSSSAPAANRTASAPRTNSWITSAQQAPQARSSSTRGVYIPVQHHQAPTSYRQPHPNAANYGQGVATRNNYDPARPFIGLGSYRQPHPNAANYGQKAPALRRQQEQTELKEQEKREAAAEKIRKANDPEEDWRGPRAKARTIFQELSVEDYNNLDPRQKAAVDFNTALEDALSGDRKSGHLSTAMLDEAADKGDWSSISAPLTKALMDDLNLKGPNTDFRDFVSGKIAVSTNSIDNMSEAQDTEGFKENVLEQSKDVKSFSDLRDFASEFVSNRPETPDNWQDARRDRDALLSKHIQSRMDELFKENRLPGQKSLALDEPSEQIFDQLYSVLSGYKVNEMNAPVTDRDGNPQRFDVKPGEVVDTLDEFGLADRTEDFFKYVDVRLREELNDEEVDQVRRRFLSMNSADILKLAREG